MASKNERHCYAVIGMAHGIAEMIEEEYRNKEKNKSVMKYTKMIKERTDPCFQLWKGKLDQKEVKKINNRLLELEKKITQAKAPIVVLTSMLLGMLSDMYDNVNKRKHRRINNLLTAYSQLHRHYDKKLNRWDAYDLADELISEFYELPA